MVKIWAKAMANDKIKKDILYKRFEKTSVRPFLEHLIEICYDLDIPTPVVTDSHINHFNQFNVVRFKEIDFVESIDFDYLILENSSD